MGRDANNDRGGPDRPYSAPGVPFQRNGFRNQPFKEVNLRAQWAWNLQEGRRLLLTAELFNLFNWDNIQLAGNAGDQLLLRHGSGRCGFGRPTNPNFLSLTDNDPSVGDARPADSDQQPGRAAPGAARHPLPVLEVGGPGPGSGLPLAVVGDVANERLRPTRRASGHDGRYGARGAGRPLSFASIR